MLADLKQHEKRLQQLAKFFFRDYPEAEDQAADLYQDTVERCWQLHGTPEYGEIRNFYNWAKVIMRNRFLTLTQKKSRERRENYITYAKAGYVEYVTENEGESNLAVNEILDVIKTLDRRTASVVNMNVLKGMSFRDIAKKKKCSYWTIYRIYKKGIEELRFKLQHLNDEAKYREEEDEPITFDPPLQIVPEHRKPSGAQKRKSGSGMLQLWPEDSGSSLHQPRAKIRNVQRKKVKNPYYQQGAGISQLAIDFG